MDKYIEFIEFLKTEYGATINDCTMDENGDLFVSVEDEDGYISTRIPDIYQDQEI